MGLRPGRKAVDLLERLVGFANGADRLTRPRRSDGGVTGLHPVFNGAFTVRSPPSGASG
jgi:hypothetical protein